MSMDAINISLPEGLRRYVEQRVNSGDFGDASEYIGELVRQDREQYEQCAQERLEALLLEGIASGPAEAIGPGEWESIRVEARDRIGRRKEAESTQG